MTCDGEECVGSELVALPATSRLICGRIEPPVSDFFFFVDDDDNFFLDDAFNFLGDGT